MAAAFQPDVLAAVGPDSAASPLANASPTLEYFTVPPCRVFDSRLPADAPALQVDVERLIQVTGVCGIPDAAAAVAVNLTVVNSTGPGGLGLYAGDGTSTLGVIDFPVSRPRANNAVVQLASSGAGTLKALYSASGANQTVDFILDVNGYFIDATPPAVTSTSPANGATGVPLASTLSITFSKPVTVTGSAFQLACSPGSAPSFTVTPASPATTYVLHPGASLPFDSSCTVTVVAAQVTDAGGRNMASDYVFSFATPPIANDDTYPETPIGNVAIDSSKISFNVLANDSFNSPVTISAFDATSANGGTVAMNSSNGQFTYNPAAGYTGADTFTYTIHNAHGSSTATVHLTISGILWFIDGNAGAGDGRLSSPFNSLAAFQAVNDGASCNALNTPRCHPAASANAFLYDNASAYTGPVTLLDGQKLIGQDATSSLSTISGLTPGTSSATLPSTGGGSPNKVSITATGNDVTLGSGNTVWGLTLGNATGTALTGASVGSLKLRDLTIANTTGAAVSLANGALDAIVKSISSGGGTHGISLASTTGSFDVEGNGASDPANTTRGRTTAKNGGGTLTLGSGGTIQGATSAGVLLSSAINVTLRNVTIQNNGGSGLNNGGDGIDASGSSSLTLDNVLITGHAGNHGLYASSLAGLAVQHSQISSNATNSSLVGLEIWNVGFGVDSCSSSCPDGLSGTATAANSILDTTLENAFGMVNRNTSTVSLAVTNSQLSHTRNAGLMSKAFDSANVSISITGSDIHHNGDGGVYYFGYGASGGGTITVKSSTFDQNTAAAGIDIDVVHDGKGKTLTFDIESNTMRQTPDLNSFAAISIEAGAQSSSGTLLQGKILNNTVGNPTVTDSGSALWSGIVLQTFGPGTLTALVTGNTVTQVDQDALLVLAASPTTSALNVTASGNDFEVSPIDSNANLGLELTAGRDGGSNTICANISGNSKEIGKASVAGIATRALGTSTIELQGYGGAPNDNTAIAAFLQGTATVVAPAAKNLGGGGTVKAAPAACPIPP
jgi:Bacterial Ig-like domain/Cadherin-like domain